MAIEIGDRFGNLTIIEKLPTEKSFEYKCKCDCGNERIFRSTPLLTGNNKSCGCLTEKHGLTGTRIYRAWSNMKRRCNDSTNKSYANYGGRGISYEDRWEEFENFYNDMKDSYQDDLTIDRIDVNKNYSKDNCRWADKKTQANNTTSNNIVHYNGEDLTLSELADKYNLNYDVLRHRMNKGFTLEESMEPPKEKETLTYNGQTKTVTEWAEENGMTYHQLKKRLMRGWDLERAIKQPLRKRPTTRQSAKNAK